LIKLSKKGGGDRAVRTGGAQDPVDPTNNGLALFNKLRGWFDGIDGDAINGQSTTTRCVDRIGIRKSKTVHKHVDVAGLGEMNQQSATALFSIGGKPSEAVGVGGGDGSKVTETTRSRRQM